MSDMDRCSGCNRLMPSAMLDTKHTFAAGEWVRQDNDGLWCERCYNLQWGDGGWTMLGDPESVLARARRCLMAWVRMIVAIANPGFPMMPRPSITRDAIGPDTDREDSQ